MTNSTKRDASYVAAVPSTFGLGRVLGMAALLLMLAVTSCQKSDTAQGAMSFNGAPAAMKSAESRSGGAFFADEAASDKPASPAKEMVVLDAKDSEELKKLEEQVEAIGGASYGRTPSPNSALGMGGGGGGREKLSGKRSALPSTSGGQPLAPGSKSQYGTSGKEADAGRDAVNDPGRTVAGRDNDGTSAEEPAQDPATIARNAAIASANDIYRARQGELWAKPIIRTDAAIPATAFPLKHTAVNASVSGYVASTTVSQTYSNDFESAIEAVYVFPLPADSAVNGFTMTIGERTIVGLIRKREEAKEIYETAKRHGFTASLLEQERPNIFTQSIANIAPKQDIKVDITYHNQLKRVKGQYEYQFPMVVGPRYLGNAKDAERIKGPVIPEGMRNGHDISLKINVDAGLPIGKINSVNHKIAEKRLSGNEIEVTLDRADTIPNRDFVLRFDVLGADIQTGFVTHAVDGRGYLSLMFTPPANPNAVDLSPREVTFLLDISGSMHGTPLDLSKRIVTMALDRLRPHDTFNIFFFAGADGQLWELPKPNTPENVAAAKQYLSRMEAGGGTEMLNGLRRLFAAPRANNALRMVVFLTDAMVGDESEILALVKAQAAGSRFFIYGVGSSVNHYLIDGIGKHGRGYATTVYPRETDKLEVSVEEFFSRIDAPCLTDITIDWGGLPVSEMYPSVVGDVFAGHPVTLVAQYAPQKGGQSGTIKIRGRKAGAPVEYSIQVDLPETDAANGAIASVWARQKIESLMDARLGTDGRPDYEVLTGQIVDVALAHKLVSEGTSFVAVDESQRVSNGDPKRVNVPLEQPEGVDRKHTQPGAAGGEK